MTKPNCVWNHVGCTDIVTHTVSTRAPLMSGHEYYGVICDRCLAIIGPQSDIWTSQYRVEFFDPEKHTEHNVKNFRRRSML